MSDQNFFDVAKGLGADVDMRLRVPIESDHIIDESAGVQSEGQRIGGVLETISTDDAAVNNINGAIVIDGRVASNAAIESEQDAGISDELTDGGDGDHARALQSRQMTLKHINLSRRGHGSEAA